MKLNTIDLSFYVDGPPRHCDYCDKRLGDFESAVRFYRADGRLRRACWECIDTRLEFKSLWEAELNG
jgi:hypothetical protein